MVYCSKHYTIVDWVQNVYQSIIDDIKKFHRKIHFKIEKHSQLKSPKSFPSKIYFKKPLYMQNSRKIFIKWKTFENSCHFPEFLQNHRTEFTLATEQPNKLCETTAKKKQLPQTSNSEFHVNTLLLLFHSSTFERF